MCLTGDGNPGFLFKATYHTKMHTAEMIGTQCLTWMNFLPRESETDKLYMSDHTQDLVPFLIPGIASNSRAAVPGNSYSLLLGGTLPIVAASTDNAGLLATQLASSPLRSASSLCCDSGMAEELVLSPTLNYFQNSSTGAYVSWLSALRLFWCIANSVSKWCHMLPFPSAQEALSYTARQA